MGNTESYYDHPIKKSFHYNHVDPSEFDAAWKEYVAERDRKEREEERARRARRRSASRPPSPRVVLERKQKKKEKKRASSVPLPDERGVEGEWFSEAVVKGGTAMPDKVRDKGHGHHQRKHSEPGEHWKYYMHHDDKHGEHSEKSKHHKQHDDKHDEHGERSKAHKHRDDKHDKHKHRHHDDKHEKHKNYHHGHKHDKHGKQKEAEPVPAEESEVPAAPPEGIQEWERELRIKERREQRRAERRQL